MTSYHEQVLASSKQKAQSYVESYQHGDQIFDLPLPQVIENTATKLYGRMPVTRWGFTQSSSRAIKIRLTIKKTARKLSFLFHMIRI